MLVGLPLSWSELKKYWYLVLLWVLLLAYFNTILYQHIKEALDNINQNNNI